MRTLHPLLAGLILLLGFAPLAHAQGQNWDGRGYFHVSFGGQPGDQSFTDSSTFTIYNERGAVAAGHSVGGGTLFDLAAGARVWRNVGIGLAYSTVSNKNDAVVSVRVPHPVIFGQSREASATASDIEHSENVVHLQFVWMLPFRDKFQLAFMVGPSFFTVRQEAATVRAPQDIRDVAPFTTVTITNVTVTDTKDSPVGVNVGVDGTYLWRAVGVGGWRPTIGLGGFLRYSGASLDLPAPAGVTRDEDLKAGGFQAAGGLRIRF